MMKTNSLAKAVIGSHLFEPGLISHSDGSISKGFEMEPLSSGTLEDAFEGPTSDAFFTKLSELLSRLPNLFEGQILLCRKSVATKEVPGFRTTIICFEKIPKASGYSHLGALLNELQLRPTPLSLTSWRSLLSTTFGESVLTGRIPDFVWGMDSVTTPDRTIRVLSLTELPQLTWEGCLQSLFESPDEFVVSFKIKIPDRTKIKKQLETKRRVSHALSVTSSLEVRNIESNSVLTSSEESLERILVGKETLFEVSIGIILSGSNQSTLDTARDLERLISGVGNAGLFLEGLGTLPVLQSHLPGNKSLAIRTLPILSENLSHLVPILHDYSRENDSSALTLRSRTGEVCHLNLFSKENLNFNSFICGASGSGKSFLMNAIISSVLKDEPKARLCIFDIGGSYQRIIQALGGQSTSLTKSTAMALLATFLKTYPTTTQDFFRSFVSTLCGSGSHITHSHSVAIDELLKELEGKQLKIADLIANASVRPERFYQEIAHWLKPHTQIDDISADPALLDLIRAQASSFDFKELESDPVLQKTTILLLTELVWRDLLDGRYPRTLIVFDEVWRFFAQSRGFVEEMYRTLRKYRAAIVSITQSLADYGDEAFAKMLFSTSFTKIYLQNGASGEFLKNALDLPPSDITRVLSVSSKKPYYSEFCALTPNMSQVFRLYPTDEFYSLANTENISAQNKKETG